MLLVWVTLTAAAVQPHPAGADPFGSAPGSPLLVGSQPAAIAAGDFNGDGSMDLAVVNQDAGTVTVLLGNGAGQFNVLPPLAVGSAPTALAVGDYNQDGVPDLALADGGDGDVRILLGAGTGLFTLAAGSPVPVGATPVGLATADFTGAGTPDLAVANLASSSVSVLVGNGGGGFTAAPGSPQAVTNPSAVTVADFDRDGRPDLAIADRTDNSIAVLLGTGTGDFVPAPGSSLPVGTTPTALVAADFNLDGKPDVAVVNRGDGTVTVLIGNGDGSFTAAPGSPQTLNGALSAAAVGDFNGDGWPDLVIADSQANTVSLLLGQGNGDFSPAPGSPQPVGSGPDALTASDLNGDMRPDLAVGNFGDGTVSALLNVFGNVPAPCDSCDPPILGQSVNVSPVSGRVFVSLATKGSSKGVKGRRFIPLRQARQLPVGTFFDTRAGVVRLASASGRGTAQAGQFSGGIFQALQGRQDRGLTNLQLQPAGSTRSCTTAGKASAARRRLSKRSIALLHSSSAGGSFRTSTRDSSGTERGTAWDTVQRCDGTLTRVFRGTVIVRDFRLRRNITVRAGKSYLARRR